MKTTVKPSAKPPVKPMTPEEAQAIRDRNERDRKNMTPEEREQMRRWAAKFRQLDAETGRVV